LGGSWGEGPMFSGCFYSCSLSGVLLYEFFLYAIFWTPVKRPAVV
jgi:hypothetical protein